MRLRDTRRAPSSLEQSERQKNKIQGTPSSAQCRYQKRKKTTYTAPTSVPPRAPHHRRRGGEFRRRDRLGGYQFVAIADKERGEGVPKRESVGGCARSRLGDRSSKRRDDDRQRDRDREMDRIWGRGRGCESRPHRELLRSLLTH